jgi:DNA topoisomerase-3
LYEVYKITSYPRTDSCFLPWNLHKDAQSTIRTLNKNFGSDQYNAFLSKTDVKKKSPIWNDKKVTAHHAIIPVDNNFDVAKLTKDEFNIYDLICRKYAMQFLDDYKYSSSKIKTKVANEIFETSGNVPLDQGWKIANKGGEKDKEKLLPLMNKGDSVKAEKITAKSKKTTPPPYYTEATILKDMANVQKFITNPNLKKIIKEGGIGTNATRAAHMKNMYAKKFLVKEGKKLRATDKAFAIDDIAPKELKLPETTAYWEEELKLIVAGTLTLDQFMAKQDKILKRMIDKVKNGECQLKKPVSGGAGKTYTCDKCSSLIARIKSKKGTYFWACQNQKTCNSLYQDSRGKKGDLIIRVEQPKGDFPCPKCNKQMLRRQNKTNKEFFWVCSDDKCKTFCKDDDGKLGKAAEKKAKATSEHKCPKCNEGRLVKRGGKNGDFWGCNNFPKCKTAVQDDNGKPQASEDKK